MAYCKTCGRRKEKGHLCEMSKLTDSRIVHNDRLKIGADVQKEVADGKVKVELRMGKRKPLRAIGERFGKKDKPIILGENQ